MKKQLLLIIFTLFSYSLNAGNDSIVKLKRNNIFWEGAGNGMIYSINYEYIFLQVKKVRVSARIGISAVPDIFSDEFYYKYPTEINVFIGKKKDFFETGIGYTHSNETYRDYFWDNSSPDYKVRAYQSQYIFLRLGYRLQFKKPNHLGFLVRVALLPYLNYKPGFYSQAGDSKVGPDKLYDLGLYERGGYKYEIGCWGGVSVGMHF